MREMLTVTIMQDMLHYLDNAQLKKLEEVLNQALNQYEFIEKYSHKADEDNINLVETYKKKIQEISALSVFGLTIISPSAPIEKFLLHNLSANLSAGILAFLYSS